MPKTIIIGAGFAGLSAARTLLAAGDESFVLLEARDRVGGRTKPGALGDLTVDLGGMWMAPTQDQLKFLAASYKVRTYPTYLAGEAIFRISGKERRGKREKFDNLLGIRGGLAYLMAHYKLRRLMKPLDCEQPWNHPDAARLDATTVEQWIVANVRHRLLRAAFRTICSTLLCAETSQVSLLFFLHYLKAGEGLDTLISSDTGGAQNLMFHGGVHQLSTLMAAELGNRLHLNAPVDHVLWQEGEVTVRSGDRIWTAQNLIVAIPPTLLSRIAFTPPLPQRKRALHDRLTMGSSIKFWVMYETPFWREMGLNGSILRDDTPATPIMDVSPPGQDTGVLVGFIDGDHALQYADLSVQDRKAAVLASIAEHFGPRSLTPVAYLDHVWSTEEWSGGCYGAFAPPGVFSNFGQFLRAPFGPLHWAGTETSSVWTGYIEGAIRSGQRAAREVIAKPSRQIRFEQAVIEDELTSDRQILNGGWHPDKKRRPHRRHNGMIWKSPLSKTK